MHIYWQPLSSYQLIVWLSLYLIALSANSKSLSSLFCQVHYYCLVSILFAWFLSLSFLMCLSLLLRWVTSSILLVLVLSQSVSLCLCNVVYACVHVHIHVKAGGQCLMSSSITVHLICSVSHWTQSSLIWLDYLASECQGSSCLCPPSATSVQVHIIISFLLFVLVFLRQGFSI